MKTTLLVLTAVLVCSASYSPDALAATATSKGMDLPGQCQIRGHAATRFVERV